jgi:hypothetical protein
MIGLVRAISRYIVSVDSTLLRGRKASATRALAPNVSLCCKHIILCPIFDLMSDFWAASLQFALRVVRAGGIHIQIDDFDAGLCRSVEIARLPRPLADLQGSHFRNKETFPIRSPEGPLAGVARKLIDQRLFSFVAVTQNDGTERALVTVIYASHRPALRHCASDQLVS